MGQRLGQGQRSYSAVRPAPDSPDATARGPPGPGTAPPPTRQRWDASPPVPPSVGEGAPLSRSATGPPHSPDHTTGSPEGFMRLLELRRVGFPLGQLHELFPDIPRLPERPLLR